MPVVPDIRETEARGSLKPRRLSQVLLFWIVTQWGKFLGLIPSIAKFRSNNNNVPCEI